MTKNKLENLKASSQTELRDMNAMLSITRGRVDNLQSQGLSTDETKFLRNFVHDGEWHVALGRIKQLEENYNSLLEERESEDELPVSEEQRDIVEQLTAKSDRKEVKQTSSSSSSSINETD